MRLAPLPAQASWHHRGEGREGYETLHLEETAGGLRLRGTTALVEDGVAVGVAYDVDVGPDGRTRGATVRLRGSGAETTMQLLRDAADRWTVDGVRRPELDGCRDVDLEASAATNVLPLRRLELGTGATSVSAAFVRLDLTVLRLEQTYALLPAEEPGVLPVAYTSPTFGYAGTIVVDDAGLSVDYPGIGVRAR